MNQYLDIKKTILEKIKENDSIIIVRHTRPDGDCLGSTLGLRDILRASFPQKKIYSIGFSKAEYLSFVGQEDDDVSDEVYKKSLIIAVDTAVSNRIDNQKYVLGKEIIKIDHHINVEEYGNINYVREELPAASLIIVDFYKTFMDELKLPKSAAFALYLGIVTDTGRFCYRGVGAETLELSSILLKQDLDLEKMYSRLYIKENSALKLQGLIYQKYKTTKNGVSYFYITNKIMKQFNLDYDSACATVNSLDSIKGNLIWILFIDQGKNEIRVRIRSRFVECVKIGQAFRGGGHANACGATVLNKKEMKKLVKMADEILGEYKETHEGWL